MTEDLSKNPAFDPAWKNKIEEDHHAIKEILEGLEATTDLRHLLSLLDELRSSLVEHFAREEAPEGLHEIISSMSPNTVASLQNILGEHQEILGRLDRLRVKTRACLEGPVAALLDNTATLSESLRDHEVRETRLFTDAVFTDLGRSS